MSLIDKLGAKKEAEAFYQAVDTAVSPDEREVIVKAGEALLWAIAWRVLVKLGVPLGALTVITLTIFGSQATGSTVPGVVSDTVTFEPGTGFSVANYCKSAKTVTVANVPGAEVIGTRRVAKNTDLDYVEWLDNNSNTSAVRYYVDKQGKPQHETVDVEGAIPCMRVQR